MSPTIVLLDSSRVVSYEEYSWFCTKKKNLTKITHKLNMLECNAIKCDICFIIIKLIPSLIGLYFRFVDGLLFDCLCALNYTLRIVWFHSCSNLWFVRNFQFADSCKFIDAIHAGNGEIDPTLLSNFSIKSVASVCCKL